jgi:hypothetical protein
VLYTFRDSTVLFLLRRLATSRFFITYNVEPSMLLALLLAISFSSQLRTCFSLAILPGTWSEPQCCEFSHKTVF